MPSRVPPGDAAPYVDPAMVLVTCAVFIGAPIRMIRTMVDELLERAPVAPLRRAVLDAVTEVEGLAART